MLVVMLLVGVSIWWLGSLCRVYGIYGFDAQSILTWKYAAYSGVVPYNDVFYPYGLLSYYNGVSVPFTFLYLLLPLIFTVVFFVTIRRLFGSVLMSVGLTTLLLLFAVLHNGFEVYLRYGGVIAYLCAFSIINQFIERKRLIGLFFLGIAGGLLFSLIHDSFIYSMVSILGFTIVYSIQVVRTQYDLVYEVKRQVLTYAALLVGVIIGVIPFVSYLLNVNALSEFMYNLHYLSLLSLFAKTPFLPFSRTYENIFSFIIIFSACYLISYNLLFVKIKDFFKYHLFILITIYAVLLEYRSIIRSIDRGITFVSFFLLLILISFVYHRMTKKTGYIRIFVLAVMVCIVILLPFNKSAFYNLSINRLGLQSSQCVDENMNVLLGKTKEYKQIIDYIHSKNPSALIFSYPDESAFYILNSQKPPYFFSTYDSTPAEAQKKQISYLSTVQYVIRNSAVSALQDGVPDYIRTPLLTRFIATEYTPIYQVGTYQILEKAKGDVKRIIWKDEIYNLEYIPKSEGEKFLNLKGEYEINYIRNVTGVKTANTTVILKGDISNKKTTHLDFILTDGKHVTVQFQSCEFKKVCLIRLKNIPAFYMNAELFDINYRLEKKTPSIGIISDLDDRFW